MPEQMRTASGNTARVAPQNGPVAEMAIAPRSISPSRKDSVHRYWINAGQRT